MLNIPVSFQPIDMLLGYIWRGNWGAQKTSLNWSKPVHIDRSFCGLSFEILKDQDCSLLKRPVLMWFFPVLDWSWDWTFKH